MTKTKGNKIKKAQLRKELSLHVKYIIGSGYVDSYYDGLSNDLYHYVLSVVSQGVESDEENK